MTGFGATFFGIGVTVIFFFFFFGSTILSLSGQLCVRKRGEYGRRDSGIHRIIRRLLELRLEVPSIRHKADYSRHNGCARMRNERA